MRHFIYFIFLTISTISYGQDFYDMNTVQTIEITFAESNWDQLLDAQKAGDEDYILAQSVSINGEVFDSVGVKYKGNSTYNANQTKNPFHIELDTYKNHKYGAYTDIKLSNVAKDPSFLREVLSYQVLRQYMDAPLSNYANVYVNGNLIGLYSNSESISKKFVDNRFGSKTNAFVKCNPPEGAGPNTSDYPNLVYLGQDSTDYYDAYEIKSDGGWQELIDLCDVLGNNSESIESVLDVDRALWMLAFNNVFVNLDSYSGGFKQNYYLYRDDSGRFLPIVWDLNESFGIFSQTGSINLNGTTDKQRMTHLLHENDSDFPLIQKLLSVPMYKKMYLAHIKTMLLENFDNSTYQTTGEALQTLIDASVQADNNKFYTYNNFLTNLTSDIGGGGGGPGGGGNSSVGITNLMDARSTYLLGLSDFTATEPTINDVTQTKDAPSLNETISVTATITDENDVYLGYRSGIYDPFTRIEMYDDGAHDDGVAGDGIYGANLTVTSSFTQYYIYAENDNIGKFSPVRAEHEYYTIDLSTTAESDVVINEFMASNDAAITDQDGEYEDWVELYNNGTEDVDLEGYYLSDNAEDLTTWSFPAGTIIEAGGYLTVWADKDTDQEGLHADFKLSAGEESVLFVDPSGTVILDQIDYVDQTTDVSYGRYPNGTGDFQTLEFTFGSENSIGRETIGVVINEFMASNDTTVTDQDAEYEDWIELYNNGTEAIDLGGFFMSDDATDLGKWEFPVGTIIEPASYLIVWADGDIDQEGLHADFKLSASAETVLLTSPDTLTIVDQIAYGEQTTDISFGRYPNGTGDFQTMLPTFNAENSIVTECEDNGGDADNDGICADLDCDDNDATIGGMQAEGTACDDGDVSTENDVIQEDGCTCIGTAIGISDVVINEFMASNDATAADQDGEYEDWIELYNNGSQVVDLSGFFMTDDETDLGQWEIPAGTVIEPGGYLIIWADGDTDQEGLHADFKLSGTEEAVLLISPDTTTIIDAISYGEQTTDISFGRYPNGTGDFRTMDATFGSENMISTGTNNIDPSEIGLSIFPNPTQNGVTISTEEKLSMISLHSITGQKISEFYPASNEVYYDVSTVINGMYFIKVITQDEKVVMQKIIIQH